MDTIETNEAPVGEEGATSSPDTVSDDTQSAQTDETFSEGEAEQAESSESLLAGKYKSPEELEKAYTELQSKFGEVGQKAEVANLLEKQTGMNAQQIKDYISRQQLEQQQQAIQENPLGYVDARVRQLENQNALMKEEAILDKYLSSEEGKPYQKNRDEIMEAAFYMPRFKNQPYPDIAKSLFGESRAQGQQDAYKKIEQKQGTQATGASQAAPKGRLTSEDMDRMSATELEAVLPWADTSDRLY